MGILNKMERTQCKTLRLLSIIWLVAVTPFVKGINECGPMRWDPKCDEWNVCVLATDSNNDAANFCVEINDCTNHNGTACPWGEVCCGHGPEKCMCPFPRLRNKKGECVECDCGDEICTLPHGECACGNGKVRDHNGQCVDCYADYNCPDCPRDKICQAAQGTSCVCRPEFVLDNQNECVWCQACPECPPGKICMKTGLGEATCECPAGRHELADGTCETTPYCDPECTDGKWCVVREGGAACECPAGHIPHGSGCMYISHPKVLPKHVEHDPFYSGSGYDHHYSGSGHGHHHSGFGGW